MNKIHLVIEDSNGQEPRYIEDALRPCPACGATAVVMQAVARYPDTEYYAECTGCGLRGPKMSTKDNAAYAWALGTQVLQIAPALIAVMDERTSTHWLYELLAAIERVAGEQPIKAIATAIVQRVDDGFWATMGDFITKRGRE